MNLTSKEGRTLRKLSHPWWPRIMLWCIIGLAVCGVVSLGLSISGMKLYRMIDGGMQPATITVLSETWGSLLIGGVALMSAIFAWAARSYGLLIRKLADNPAH